MDPPNDKRSIEVYSLRQKALLDVSEARTDSAVRSLDDCNRVNQVVALRLQPKRRPWWRPLW